jgi:uncharacterized protein YdcH (DUF465 family)
MDRNTVKQELLEVDDEFRRLYEEHRECEGVLETLTHQSVLSQDDEAEAKRIKLHKLALKDQMESLIRSHAAS